MSLIERIEGDDRGVYAGVPTQEEDVNPVKGKRHQADESERREVELIDLPNDAYTFIFLAETWSQGFWFGILVFVMKIGIFSVLFLDAYETLDGTIHADTSRLVRATQAVILPVAVAMQEDLRSTYTILSNAKYSHVVMRFHPDATKGKYYLSNFLRGADGLYSLCINFSVLLLSETVRDLFLNFAALEFLQTIDNIAFELAKEGFLTPSLESWACKVEGIRMPKRESSNILTAMDSVLFVATVENFFVVWAMFKFY